MNWMWDLVNVNKYSSYWRTVAIIDFATMFWGRLEVFHYTNLWIICSNAEQKWFKAV